MFCQLLCRLSHYVSEHDVLWLMRRKPCIAARPAYSQSMQPPVYVGLDYGRPMLQSSATHFHDVRPMPQPRRDFVIHPELLSENLCPAEASLHSQPVRQCDIAAALIQRASQRRYVKNPFAY